MIRVLTRLQQEMLQVATGTRMTPQTLNAARATVQQMAKIATGGTAQGQSLSVEYLHK